MKSLKTEDIKRVPLVLVIIGFIFQISCKPTANDSVTITDSDSTKVESMVKAGELLIEVNPDSASIFFNNALEYYQEYLKNSGLAKDLPIWLQRQAALAHRGLGVYYTNSGDFQKAIDELDNAINTAQGYKELNPILFSKDIVLILNSLGVAQKKKGLYKEALETYQQAQSIACSSGDSVSVAIFYTNTGNIYQELGDVDKAYEYVSKALELHQKNGNRRGIAISSITLANLLNSSGRFEEARPYYHTALEFCVDNKLFANIGLINSNLGVLEKRLGNYEVAQQHFMSAVKNLSKVGNRQGLALVYGNLADLAIATNSFSEAIEYASKQLDEAIQTNALVNQRYAYKHLSKAYAQIGNYKKAFENQQNYLLIHDSIMSVEKQKEISRLEAVFQDEKKNEEIKHLESLSEVLENKNKLKGIMLVSVSALMVFLALLGATLIRNSKLKAKRKQLLLEHKLLRSQMNPHFLFNSLSTIQNLILRADKMEAATQVANFSNFIRFILDSSRDNLISLEKEIEAINLFLNLQQVRFPNLFTFSVNVELNEDAAELLVPPLIIQPFVENAVIHGFSKGTSGGLLQIHFFELNGYLCSRVKDNGVGISFSETRKEGTHKSVATQITRERLELLNKRFKTSAGLEYEVLSNNEKGTSVLITLPLLFNDNEYK